MNPDAERLIDLATRPLENNAELRLAAEAELRQALEAHAADRPEAITEAADSLARADLRPKRGRWKSALLIITALVSVPLFGHTIWQLQGLSKVKSFAPLSANPASSEANFPGLTDPQRLLLLGKGGAVNEPDRWKALWESAPENPVFLAKYAAAYLKAHDHLSPEILAAAERIDPDNGWFPALHAAGMAKGAVTREKQAFKDTKLGTAPVMTVHDEKRLQNTLAAIHEIAEKPRFSSYQVELLRKQIPLLPPRRDWVSQLPLWLYVGSMNTPGIETSRFADVLAAGADQCAAKGDVDGFRRIVGDWHAFATRATEGGDTMIDLLLARASITKPAANFRDAARKLGLESEALYFAGIHARAQQEKDARKAGNIRETMAIRHGSAIASMSLPMLTNQVNSPPVLDVADLRPGCYADHALFGRLASWLGIILLGFAAASASSARYRQRPLACGLSKRIEDLLRPSDWAWMLLGGIIFPLAWYFAITRLTPLSAREWSMRMTVFIQPGGQFGSMVASMIILPVLIASRRLAKRGAVFGLKGRFQWLGWVTGISALLGVPTFGGIMLPGIIGQLCQWTAFGLTGIVTVWLVAGGALCVFARASQPLRRATLARLLCPVWVCGILALVAMIPFYYAEERTWIQRDRLSEISADAPALSRYEYQVTQVLRRETLELLGKPPETR